MTFTAAVPEKSRLRALLDHFATIEDPREPWRVAHPLPEVLLLVVCGTIADCDDYESIAGWGEAHLSFLRRFLPYHHGAPRARWLTMLMNRIDHPELFSAAFTAWVRQTWPDRPEFVAIDGKTSRRSHARAAGKAPLHLVFGLRHHQPPGARSGGGRRQDQQDHRHSAALGAARREGRAARNAGVDRCHRHQSDHRGRDPGRTGRLSPRREGQPDPIGTGDEVERTLREGGAIRDFKLPDRIVVRTDDERALAPRLSPR